MTPAEKQYRYHLHRAIRQAVEKAGGPAKVGKRCGMLPHCVTALGEQYLPSLRVLLRVASACGTTPAALCLQAEQAVARVSADAEAVREMFPTFGENHAFDDGGC